MRCPSSDGVEVAVHDLGGDGPPLLLVHPTGFCAQVMAPLAGHLGERFRCWGIDVRGHGMTLTPEGIELAWSGFADDVLAAVNGLGLHGAMAFGHSAGGAAVLLAEAERPGTFAALWCYEPIVWADAEAGRARGARLSEGTLRRRDRFASREAAYENYAAKPPFAGFRADALRAYVECGFADEEDGSVALRCRREVEAEIYRRAAEGDRFGRLRDVACPVTVAAGARTDAIRPELARDLADALPAGRVEVFEGLAHFGPQEDPAVVAEAAARDLLRSGAA